MIGPNATEALGRAMAKEFGGMLHTDDQTWRDSARHIADLIEQQGFIIVAGTYGSPPIPRRSSDGRWD